MTAAIEQNSGPIASSPLSYEVFDTFDDANISREEWDGFIFDVGGDLYVTYDWCVIWWRHYGAKRRLRLFVFRRGMRLVGLAPFFIETVRFGPIKLKIAKRLCSDFALTIYALPLAEADAGFAYRKLINDLIDEGCDLISYGFLPGNDRTLGCLIEACASLRTIAAMQRNAPAGVQTVFHLPDNFERFIESLDKRRRQNYRRNAKLLSRNFQVKSNVTSDPRLAEEAFANFKSFHARQWAAEGKTGHFGDWPRSAAFNFDLVKELSLLGRLRMVQLIADGNLIAEQYAFTFGDRCYWRLPARAVDSDMNRFGLGTLGLLQLIDEMIKERVRWIEAGGGHYDYKIQHGGQEIPYRSVVVGSVRSPWRVRLFFFAADAIHLVYYKIWRLRIVPRLPLPRRPLWLTWIRFRL